MHDGRLGAACVGQQGARRTTRGDRQHLLGDAIDGGAKYGDLRLLNGRSQVERSFVNRAGGQGPVEVGLVPAGADDAPGQAAPSGGQADGAADQADADDGERLDSHQVSMVSIASIRPPQGREEIQVGVPGTRSNYSKWTRTCLDLVTQPARPPPLRELARPPERPGGIEKGTGPLECRSPAPFWMPRGGVGLVKKRTD